MSAPELAAVLAAIDAVNAADPGREPDGRPAALVYGERMSAELAQSHPDASELLQIAARGQHIERWTLPRTEFPEGRAGYLAWRSEEARRHADRVGRLMDAAGYGTEARAHVGALLRKENLKADPEAQALEDVACFVFLRWYFPDFAPKHPAEDVRRIVAKTARKMSATARREAAAQFALPAELAAYFQA